MKANKFAEGLFVCGVCLQEKNENQARTFCQAHPNLCQLCYHGHIQSHINSSMKQISCPFENCEQKMGQNSPSFLQLPEETGAKYFKLLERLKQAKEKVRYCPTCNGKLTIDVKVNNLFCKKCNKQLCKECLSLAHEFRGKCEINVLFELKCKFRQCPSCRFIVQKSQGCDHMACLCGYHFCYVCGKNRTSYFDHKCEDRGRKRSL